LGENQLVGIGLLSAEFFFPQLLLVKPIFFTNRLIEGTLIMIRFPVEYSIRS